MKRIGKAIAGRKEAVAIAIDKEHYWFIWAKEMKRSFAIYFFWVGEG